MRFVRTWLARNGMLVILSLFSTGMMTSARASLVISGDPTANVTCSHQVCAATSSNAVFNKKQLQNLLAGSSVKLVSGSLANDIVVDVAITWVSSNTLTLDSYHSITVDKSISVAGAGGLTLTTNDGGTGGAVFFAAPGKVNFLNLSSSLTINGNTYILVNTIASLAGDIVANPSGNFALAAYYDATPDGTYTTSPVSPTFTGKFEGLGNTISKLKIVDATKSDHVGLFSQIGSGGIVSHLALKQIVIKANGTGMYVGGLVGAIEGGTVVGASVSGTVTTGYVGRVGGLVGGNFGGAIRRSSAAVMVRGGEYVGGLVGQNSAGGVASSITGSYASGRVIGGTGTLEFVGGLVGFNETLGTIARSFATGAVTGGTGSNVGGLVGLNVGDNAPISDSYATGSVTGGENSLVGGFVGGNSDYGAISNAYSTGTVTGGAGSLVGGFIGKDWLSVDIGDCYWDTTTSGITNLSQGAGNVSNDPGITGLTTIQLQSGLPAGFDPLTWGQNSSINGGLPYLLTAPPP